MKLKLTSATLLVLPDTPYDDDHFDRWKRECYGTVVEVGPKDTGSDDIEVKKGDRVLWFGEDGYIININGLQHVIMGQYSISAVVEEE